ncbi:MAG: hypothetical protein ACFE8U_08950, partial [Candidatus Hermodarchaeota archaeon]
LNLTNEEIKEGILKAEKRKQLRRDIGVLFYSMDREQQFLSDFKNFFETKFGNQLRDTIDNEAYEKTYGSFFFGFTGSE